MLLLWLPQIDDSLGTIEATISDETNQTAYEVIGELDEIQKIIDENFKTVEDVLNDVSRFMVILTEWTKGA